MLLEPMATPNSVFIVVFANSHPQPSPGYAGLKLVPTKNDHYEWLEIQVAAVNK